MYLCLLQDKALLYFCSKEEYTLTLQFVFYSGLNNKTHRSPNMFAHVFQNGKNATFFSASQHAHILYIL